VDLEESELPGEEVDMSLKFIYPRFAKLRIVVQTEDGIVWCTCGLWHRDMYLCAHNLRVTENRVPLSAVHPSSTRFLADASLEDLQKFPQLARSECDNEPLVKKIPVVPLVECKFDEEKFRDFCTTKRLHREVLKTAWNRAGLPFNQVYALTKLLDASSSQAPDVVEDRSDTFEHDDSFHEYVSTHSAFCFC
jgi:hypothetical protein